MGRPSKPIEQKRRTGNPGKRSLPAVANLAAVPAIEPGEYEMTPAVALERVLEMGVSWLAATDSPTVCLLRDAVEFYAELRADPKAKPADVIAANKQVAGLLAQLGFDPTARSKLGLAEVRAASKLEQLRRAREG